MNPTLGHVLQPRIASLNPSALLIALQLAAQPSWDGTGHWSGCPHGSWKLPGSNLGDVCWGCLGLQNHAMGVISILHFLMTRWILLGWRLDGCYIQTWSKSFFLSSITAGLSQQRGKVIVMGLSVFPSSCKTAFPVITMKKELGEHSAADLFNYLLEEMTN